MSEPTYGPGTPPFILADTLAEAERRFQRFLDSRSRERAIRAVVASQWAVAVAQMWISVGGGREARAELPDFATGSRIAALPCAVDLVDGTTDGSEPEPPRFTERRSK